MMNKTRERALSWLLPGLTLLTASACVPDRDASIGKTDNPLKNLDVAACEAMGGVATTDPGDGSLLESGCPDGAETLGNIDQEGWIEGGLCCGKPEAAGTTYTVAECEAAGGVPTTDPGDGSLIASGCPDGAETIGTIDEESWREGGLCCGETAPPPSDGLTVAECEAAGGVAQTDPGDGSLIANGCPDGAETLGNIDEEGWIEGGLCCAEVVPPHVGYTVAECEMAGGVARTDPGDGSLIASGCPDGEQTLGPIDEDGWIEGGLCCGPAEAPVSYTIAECQAAGAVARPDPGDGSLLENGCPDGEKTLGTIDANWDEGGLCCGPAD